MKKTIFSALFVTMFGIFAVFQRSQASVDAVNATTPAQTTTAVLADSNTQSPTPAQTTRNNNEDVSEVTSDEESEGATPTKTTPAVTTPTPVTTPAPAPVKPKPVPVATNSLYKDGTFTGAAADAYYGNIQVKVTTKNDKIVDVVFLDYPHDRGTSREINNYAMPQLKAEAIQTQSANVDTVSGATDSSGAFRESMTSALAAAHV